MLNILMTTLVAAATLAFIINTAVSTIHVLCTTGPALRESSKSIAASGLMSIISLATLLVFV